MTAKLTVVSFRCFNSSVAMYMQFWLCYSRCLVSSHLMSKSCYKSLFPTSLRFIMLSVNGNLDTPVGPFPDAQSDASPQLFSLFQKIIT